MQILSLFHQKYFIQILKYISGHTVTYIVRDPSPRILFVSCTSDDAKVNLDCAKESGAKDEVVQKINDNGVTVKTRKY